MAKNKKSKLLYIMNPNCGWCKKADPVVEELVKDGYKIKTLNVQDPEDQKKAQEVIQQYGVQCGTPLFIDSSDGNMVCGFRPKETLEVWAKGEKVPAPPQKDAPDQPSAPQEMMVRLEYVWLDGEKTKNLRSKMKHHVMKQPETNDLTEIMASLPQMTFDGSSTSQASVEDSDLVLRPVKLYPIMPARPQQNQMPSFIVLCEVFNPDGTAHESNTRFDLRNKIDELELHDLTVGIEQEYMFWDPSTDLPSGWKTENDGESSKNYCGVGTEKSINKTAAEAHAMVCMSTGIPIEGYHPEVTKSQWEYQTRPTHPLRACDDLWITRFLLLKVAEGRDLTINFDPKPFDNVNGSGCHINFSTKYMREEGGQEYIDSFCESLALNHEKAIELYGEGNEKRLTGANETSKIDEFTYGVSDRSASIRIPVSVSQNEKGYLEDRRPGANVDPYQAVLNIAEVANEVDEKSLVEA